MGVAVTRPKDFFIQLENLRHEAGVAARYVYAEMAIQHAASKSKKLLNRLNDTPTFWIACGAAFQSAAYIALGRMFDTTSRYNVEELLKTLEDNLHLFQPAALAERKRNGKAEDPDWLAEYLAEAYYPTLADVLRIRKKVDGHRAVYERAIKPVRHKYLAHREKQERSEVSALYAAGTVKEIWRLATFLLQLHDVLWQLLHNGRRPVFRAMRYSVKSIFDSSAQGSHAHESMVGEVKKLMALLETATPNPSIERTRPGKPGRASHVRRWAS
ncbi:transposase [Roseateles violae]|uniref:Transposase n=1 Tax=Roseateles violae TaxID=3058042 RepID=A0ABT8DPZ3_9BURK|nr:transposase [Pelomonas sp. PFR6]MDN3920410.1 transposase [Pelomonas sp. PFR6]